MKVSALFHDVEKSTGIDHGEAGAQTATEFLSRHGYSGEFIDQVVFCVRHHTHTGDEDGSNATLLALQDCDLLDECGSVGILWSVLAVQNPESYGQVLDHIGLHHTEENHMRLRGRCGTEIGKGLMDERLKFEKAFIENLEADLGLEKYSAYVRD